MKTIPAFELQFEFTRSRGPGGQHVNKTNSAVILRWYPMLSSILTPFEKERLSRKWHNKLTVEGEFILRVEESREQDRNKKLAIERLHELLEEALKIPKKRISTKPSYSQKQKRMNEKRKRSEIKKTRQEKIR
jgi:ribosome-associated protein